MAGVKFIANCHIQWIERSSKHRHKLGYLLSSKIPHHRCAILPVLILFKTTRPRAYIAFSLEALVGHQREELVCQISKLLTVHCKNLSTLKNPADNHTSHPAKLKKSTIKRHTNTLVCFLCVFLSFTSDVV